MGNLKKGHLNSQRKAEAMPCAAPNIPANHPGAGIPCFLSNYERTKVALQCRECNVVFWPELLKEAGECPCCFATGRHTPLLSAFRPAQDPAQRIAFAKRAAAEQELTKPPRAWGRRP